MDNSGFYVTILILKGRTPILFAMIQEKAYCRAFCKTEFCGCASL